MAGFRKFERTGVLVVPGDRVAVPVIVLEVGTRTETVEVSAQAPLLQAQTAERSSTITKEAVDEIPTYSSGTFFAQIVSLAPGVSATASNTLPAWTLSFPVPASRALPPGPTTCWTV